MGHSLQVFSFVATVLASSPALVTMHAENNYYSDYLNNYFPTIILVYVSLTDHSNKLELTLKDTKWCYLPQLGIMEFASIWLYFQMESCAQVFVLDLQEVIPFQWSVTRLLSLRLTCVTNLSRSVINFITP